MAIREQKNLYLECDKCGAVTRVVHNERRLMEIAKDAGWMVADANHLCASCKGGPQDIDAAIEEAWKKMFYALTSMEKDVWTVRLARLQNHKKKGNTHAPND